MTDERPVVGVDLGGTTVLSAVIDPAGKILSRAKVRTQADTGVENVLDRIAGCVREAIECARLEVSDIAGMTIGSPGPLDSEKGIVIDAPNLGGWKNVPLADGIHERIGVRTFVENDVDAGTLAEFVYGAARGASSVVGVFVGTGIGGGVIIDGKLVSGASGISGEIGHIIVRTGGDKCGCGLRGCMEAYAGRKNMARWMRQAVQKGEESMLADVLADDIMKLKSKKLKKAWKAEDPLTRRALGRACKFLGAGIGSVINLLSPDVIVMGGGVYEALGKELLPILIPEVKRNALKACAENVRIVLAELGDDAVVLGAGVMARRRLGV